MVRLRLKGWILLGLKGWELLGLKEWDLVGFVLQPKSIGLTKIRSNLGPYFLRTRTATSFFRSTTSLA
ncbi:hypothetical protein HanRHA438_Chr07g0307651 [Helianthus annuus]|nr:hypothetical protein HanRHA438_Chr07g0307651 [Helianthus annuus]